MSLFKMLEDLSVEVAFAEAGQLHLVKEQGDARRKEQRDAKDERKRARNRPRVSM